MFGDFEVHVRDEKYIKTDDFWKKSEKKFLNPFSITEMQNNLIHETTIRIKEAISKGWKLEVVEKNTLDEKIYKISPPSNHRCKDFTMDDSIYVFFDEEENSYSLIRIPAFFWTFPL